MNTLQYFETHPVYTGCRKEEKEYYKPESELVNRGNKGGFKFPWYQRDLIIMMLSVMNLPIREVAEGAGVHVKTIRKFMQEHDITRDFKKVNRVSLEITRNKTMQSYLESDYASNYYMYNHMARQLTRCILSRWQTYIDPNNKLKDGNVLDHKISIKHGYCNFNVPIPLNILCHPRNLEILTVYENSSKGDSSSISLDKLSKKIQKDNKLYNPFVDFHLP